MPIWKKIQTEKENKPNDTQKSNIYVKVKP